MTDKYRPYENGLNDPTDNADGLGVDEMDVEVDGSSGAGPAPEDEVDLFTRLRGEGKPEREIMTRMGIERTKFDRLFHKMHKRHQGMVPHVEPLHEAVLIASLPKTLLEYFAKCFEAEAGVKLARIDIVSAEDIAKRCGENHSNFVMLTPLVLPGSTSNKD